MSYQFPNANQLPYYGAGQGQMGPMPNQNPYMTGMPPNLAGLQPQPPPMNQIQGPQSMAQQTQPPGFGAPPPGAMAGMAPQQQNPYGYGQAPGQSNLGYYEQQTPAGSFAAMDQAGRQMQQTAGQQTTNPYQIQGVGSVGPGGGAANPYLSQTTQQSQGAGTNPYSGENPYLQGSIDSTIRDATRGFNQAVMPRFDSMANASGSFGNTGVEQMRGQAIADFGTNLGSTIGNMRMQDYGQQQQLAENALNRTQQNSQFNSGLNAGDLNRQTNSYLTGSGLDQQGRMFDANTGLGTQQFNASAGNTAGMFNAGQGNSLGMFNAGQGNAMGQYFSGLDQNRNMTNAGAANNMLTQGRQLGQQNDQFNQNMDFNVWQGNNANMRGGTQDQISFLNTLMGMQGQGIGAATNQQNTPMNYLQQFMQMANQAGGQGGTATQNLQGNPLLGLLGGWNLGGQLYGG